MLKDFEKNLFLVGIKIKYTMRYLRAILILKIFIAFWLWKEPKEKGLV